MNKKILSVLISCLWLTAYGQNNIYLQTNFDNGIPEDFTLIDNDEAPINGGSYRNVSLSGSWSANQIDTQTNYAAFSLSRYSFDMASENWMITPVIALDSDDACLKWDARSVHFDYRESYKVMISTTNTNLTSFKEIYTIEQEEYHWKTHVISLAEYARKDIYIAFVCTSNNKFILAVDNLYIGELSEITFDATDLSRRFSGDTGTAPVKGKIRNTGKEVELKNINCIVSGSSYSHAFDNLLLQPGEEAAFEFQIPVSLNEVSRYKLEAEMEDGSVYALYEDSVMCSYYPRLLLAEKATGSWCGNCPDGTLVSNKLKERFGKDILVIEVHTNDRFQCGPYIAGIDRWISSYPSFIYNRERSAIQTSMINNHAINEALLMPATAKVDAQVERPEGTNTLTIHTQSEFALDYDNAAGTYRIGFGIIEQSVQGAAQNNLSVLISKGENYFLPATIPADIQIYHNVAREGSTAFKGVENSLPSQIESGTNYDFTYTLTIPDAQAHSDKLSLVTFVMDIVTGAVLNTTCTDIPSGITGLSPSVPNDKEDTKIIRNEDASYTILFTGPQSPYAIELIGPDGRVVNRETGIAGTGMVTVGYAGYKGCYLLKVSHPEKSVVQKIILY